MVMLLQLLDCLAFSSLHTESALGCRFKDVDGNEWIDFMCGFGAILHGYSEPRIEAAAEGQRNKAQF